MANNFMVNISEKFDMESFANEIAQQYQAKGFQVRIMKMKNGCKIVFDKKCGGINMLLGLGQGITATCIVAGKEKESLSVDFSDGDWIGKIIGLVVGVCSCFFCFITIITAIIGICKQLSLPKNISNDMNMILADME